MPKQSLRTDCGPDGQQIVFVYFAGSSAFNTTTSAFGSLFETIELDGISRLDPSEELRFQPPVRARQLTYKKVNIQALSGEQHAPE